MNGKLVLKALAREDVPRRPLWIMRQAGRCLPEYRDMRRTHSFKALSGRPDLAAEVSLLPLKRYPFDAAIVFADIMSPLPALGVQFDFAPGPVVADPVRDQAGVDAVRAADPDGLAPEVIETVARVREETPDDVAVLGFCGAPWTLAAYLVEGRGVKDFPTLRAFAAAEPAVLDGLLAKLSTAMADYLIAQAKAGADAVQVFDSWAGLLSLADWERLIRPHLHTLLETVGEAGVPRILFVQNAPHLMDAYAELPAEAISVDWRTDIAGAQGRWPDRAVQGNIDPAVLLGGEDATRRAARCLLACVEQRGHIVNLGHGLLPETPLASIDALVEAVHNEDAP
ncbi:MAG: uroporphyrinogen decarboxylase [Gammaproteobacteria bacterium]|nr:uroporphyrinogen decarboxylase [Gammaproteobacteria bacterium]